MAWKYTIAVITIVLIAASGGLKTVSAQTTILQKTLNSIEDLINAKDSETESLAARLQTFNQVIDLSLTEAKELKLKIFNLGSVEEDNADWLKERVAKIDEIIKFYEDQGEMIATQEPITLDWIKASAQEFRNWRDGNYLPLADELINFLLISQEKKAIATAKIRFQKISRDLELLTKKNIKGVEPAFELLKKTETIIDESVNLNDLAADNFWQNYSTSTATSTDATSTDATSTATSTESAATSTLPIPQTSIKDLVRDSLSKIKDAYQIFIEISNLVKKLLI